MTARKLATGELGRPRQSDLRRSISSAYYSQLHCLAKTVADAMIGTNKNTRNNLAYKQIYRGLAHGQIRQNLRRQDAIKNFPPELQLFSRTFIEMQLKRNDADYDPDQLLYRSDVLKDIEYVENAINSFYKVKASERKGFAAYATSKPRR